MQSSLEYWLTSVYRANPPLIAQDASPAALLQRLMRKLKQRWLRQINRMAPLLAKWFAETSTKRTEQAFAKVLKDAGFTIKFDATPTTTDIFRATVNENVSLIRSIAQEHLADVEQLVMRSVVVGGDMGTLAKDLKDRYQLTDKRAALIARDQNSKATAAVVRARQQEIGVTQAVWKHSFAGKHPRPAHVAANGKVYDIAKGMFLDGKWVWPGTEINCRCTSQTVIPGLQ